MPVVSVKDLTTDLLIRYGFQILGALVILGVGLLLARWVGNLMGQWLERRHLEPRAQPDGQGGADRGADVHPGRRARQVRVPGGPAGGRHRRGRPRHRHRAARRAQQRGGRPQHHHDQAVPGGGVDLDRGGLWPGEHDRAVLHDPGAPGPVPGRDSQSQDRRRDPAQPRDDQTAGSEGRRRLRDRPVEGAGGRARDPAANPRVLKSPRRPSASRISGTRPSSSRSAPGWRSPTTRRRRASSTRRWWSDSGLPGSRCRPPSARCGCTRPRELRRLSPGARAIRAWRGYSPADGRRAISCRSSRSPAIVTRQGPITSSPA